MSLVDVKRTRTAARGWLTRAVKALERTVDDEESDRLDFERGLEQLATRVNTVIDTQAAVEAILPDEELDDDIEEAGLILDHVEIIQKAATRKLEKLSVDPTSLSEVGSQSSSTQAIKLPKLELPKFHGDVLSWQTFWDKFQATIDASDLPDVTKFTYLQSLLEGDAKQTVDGLTLTSGHYKLACQLLQERFGRRALIIFSHIQGLLSLTSCTKGSKTLQLRSIQDQILIHVRSLEALSVDGSTYGLFLTPLILSRLPTDVRMEWARDGEGKESDLNYLLTFLKKEIERRQRAESFHVLPTDSVLDDKKKTGTSSGTGAKIASASVLQASSVPNCGFCQKTHPTFKCWAVLKLPIQEREQKIREHGLCFRCLRHGHLAKHCSAKCSKCQGYHNQICCYKSQSSSFQRPFGAKSFKPENGQAEVLNIVPDSAPECRNTVVDTSVQLHVDVVDSPPCNTTRVVLQTTQVKVMGPKGTTEATLLFDSGSDKTYVSSKLVNKVGLKSVGVTEMRYAVFGGGRSSSSLKNIYELKVRGLREDRSFVSLHAMEVPIICSPLSRPKISMETREAFGRLKLAESQFANEEVNIDILVGLDYYWHLVKDNIRRLPGNRLVAQDTVFGWVLSGTVESTSQCLVSPQLLCLNDLSENELRRFWDLDSIGIGLQETVQLHDKVLDDFNQSIQYKDGRYEVALPWKGGKALPKLMSNKAQALVRLNSLSRKLAKDPPLKARYDGALKEMETNKVICEVPSSEIVTPYPVFYLPHRPVVKESSSTTKVRPVFDASAKGPNNISLNDCLETGPCLIQNLVEILIRFRRWKVALTADMSKAFLQVGLQRQDQDVHRFLWDVNGSVRTMRFCRVTFGNKASPFLLNATVRYHLSKYPTSVVIQNWMRIFMLMIGLLVQTQ